LQKKPAKRERHKSIEAMKQMDNKFVSTRELGALLGVTRQTIRNWIKKGHIRAYHIGQSLKVPVQEAVRILVQYELPIPEWLKNEDLARSGQSTSNRQGQGSFSRPENGSTKLAFHEQAPLSGAQETNNRWRQEAQDDL